MNRSRGAVKLMDGDSRAVRRAARRVGVQITIACTIVVVGIFVAIYLFIISQVRPGELFELVPDPNNLDVSAEDLLRGSAVLGIALVVLTAALSWFVARRAVRPLGDALRAQRTFVADASHELRTPLTVLDARIQVLQRGLQNTDPSAPIATQLREDAKSLIDIVNQLLISAETDSPGTGHEPPTPLDPVLDVVIESMQLIADAKAVRISVDRAESVYTFLPETSAHRCLVALLDNAIRFAPNGSEVAVGVTATRSTVTMTVLDSGPGIRGIEPDRIFDRFAHSERGADHTQAPRSGFGIGLALVRDIAVRHGGSIAVVRSSPEGTQIALTVPRARDRH